MHPLASARTASATNKFNPRPIRLRLISNIGHFFGSVGWTLQDCSILALQHSTIARLQHFLAEFFSKDYRPPLPSSEPIF